MPRASQIVQADISRVLRAFRSIGVEAQVRIMTDGTVVIGPAGEFAGKERAEPDEEEIRM